MEKLKLKFWLWLYSFTKGKKMNIEFTENSVNLKGDWNIEDIRDLLTQKP